MLASVQLITTRLLLRDFREEDSLRVREYRSDARYLRYYPEEECREEDALRFVGLVMAWAGEAPRSKFQLAIVRASDDLLIGNCGIRVTSGADREAEFGCELDPREWGQGFATEAGREIIGYAFATLAIHRIWSRTIAENRSAAMLAERLGMRQEGRFRESSWMRGRWWDNIIYAVLEQEWHGKSRG